MMYLSDTLIYLLNPEYLHSQEQMLGYTGGCGMLAEAMLSHKRIEFSRYHKRIEFSRYHKRIEFSRYRRVTMEENEYGQC